MKKSPSKTAPAFLLLDVSSDQKPFAHAWLEKNGFRVCRSNTFFNAVEEIMDFTLAAQPSVVLLESTEISELNEAAEYLQEIFDCEVPVFCLAVSGLDKDSGKIRKLGKLEELLSYLNKTKIDIFARAA